MAHINLHIAAGLLAGSALATPLVAMAWWRGRLTAKPIGAGLLVTYGLGLWAAIPNLLFWSATTPANSLPFANVFVLHSWLDNRTSQGLLIGEAVIAAHLAGHYVLVMWALWKARLGLKLRLAAQSCERTT